METQVVYLVEAKVEDRVEVYEVRSGSWSAQTSGYSGQQTYFTPDPEGRLKWVATGWNPDRYVGHYADFQQFIDFLRFYLRATDISPIRVE